MYQEGLIEEIQTTVHLGKPSLVFDILCSQDSECLEGEDEAQI